jgi:hypothetical protein
LHDTFEKPKSAENSIVFSDYNSTRKKIENLEPATSYTISISSETLVGSIPFILGTFTQSFQTIASISDLNLKVSKITTHIIQLSWPTVQDELGHLPLTEKFELSDKSTGLLAVCLTSPCEIDDLDPNSDYQGHLIIHYISKGSDFLS